LLKLANSLDFGDFRQIIFYFGFSTLTHIEYRTNSSTMTYTLFCLFGVIICISFFIRKNQLSIKQFFLEIVRCMFGSKSRILTQQNSWLFVFTN